MGVYESKTYEGDNYEGAADSKRCDPYRRVEWMQLAVE